MKKYLLLALLLSPLSSHALEMPTTPSKGESESIGKYDNGCIAGAKTLPAESKDYIPMRPSRNHYYGHSNLVSLLEDLSAQYNAEYHRKMLIGDMGQPRGALMLSGHASHQIGLDLDIWFKTIPNNQNYSVQEREDTPADFLVDDNGAVSTEVWQTNYVPYMLKLATSFPEVERIFVNPKIKMALCQQYQGQGWLRKIRPWWQHREHFHVRLYCPKDSPDCVAQAPLPKTDGCDESLAWWDSDDAKAKAAKAAAAKPTKRVFKLEKLPERCQALFQ